MNHFAREFRYRIVKIRVIVKNEKSAQRGRFAGGHPADIRGVIRADVPAQNFGEAGQNRGKTSILARTSMTRRRGRPRPRGISKNFGQKNLGLNFRSLNCVNSAFTKKKTVNERLTNLQKQHVNGDK